MGITRTSWDRTQGGGQDKSVSGPRGKVGKSFALVTCTSSGVSGGGQRVTAGSHSGARRASP